LSRRSFTEGGFFLAPTNPMVLKKLPTLPNTTINSAPKKPINFKKLFFLMLNFTILVLNKSLLFNFTYPFDKIRLLFCGQFPLEADQPLAGAK